LLLRRLIGDCSNAITIKPVLLIRPHLLQQQLSRRPSFKFAATLQEKASPESPALLHVQFDSSHGSSSTKAGRIKHPLFSGHFQSFILTNSHQTN